MYTVNGVAIESQSFNKDMIIFLQNNLSPNDSKVIDRIKKHLKFLGNKGTSATPKDFVNQTEFFITDEFHRNMLEQQQIGYSYFLNKAAVNYLESL
ncbi:TipAS antibiotic-recognition domain-containing protein [Clostridium guangxiense]|uniref:TipAS antibiotic-recognition domain-containing protein n=1 Tax=Clostridium guangxiense TaxID=1662055 RepID=UPI001E3E916A|nr:TipAS antibiotic-recognition domain-containing protein [Clostridium guangxiense]MCD2346751.1 TipAS antibiotic-recognition domain-containing protein [Clostridium guangxiense]